MSDLILPGSKEYKAFRKSAEGQEILGRHTMIDSAVDSIVGFADRHKRKAYAGLILLASCGGGDSVSNAPQTPEADETPAAEAKAEPGTEYSAAKNIPTDIKSMEEHREVEAERKASHNPEIRTKEDLNQFFEKEGLNRDGTAAKGIPEDIKSMEEHREVEAERKAEESKPGLPSTIPDAGADLESFLDTPAGKPIRAVVRRRGTKVVPKIVDLIERGVWDPKHPFYGLDDIQDYKVSASLRGEAGELQSSFAERLSLSARPFSKGMLDFSVLDDVLFNIFLENTNSTTRRSYFEDMGTRNTRATAGVSARINDIFNFKDAIFILGLDYTYEDTGFSERGTTPEQKYIGMMGINAFLRVPSEDITAYLRFRGGDSGRWKSFPGKVSGNNHYNDFKKMELYADLQKKFKGGWNVGAELRWQREDFEGVKEDLNRLALTLKGGRNNFLAPFGFKSDVLNGIDLMLAYTHTQRSHETKGITNYDRIALLGAVPLYTNRQGEETLILRPEFGYEFNGRKAYGALELLWRFGK